MIKQRTFLIIAGIVTLMLLMTIIPVSGYSNDYQNQGNTEEVEYEEDEVYSKAPTWYTKPSSYAQLVSWYKTLEAAYPNYLEVFKANELYGTGTVPTAYDLYYVRITNESLGLHKPEVLFLGGPHGDETVGTIGMYWFTDWLMRMVFTDETSPEYSTDWLHWILNNREIYFVVSQNPYGFDTIQRYDSHGWDLNREYDYDGPGTPTGGIWGSVNSKTLRRFLDNHTIRVGCDFHGGARMLLYPWGSNHNTIVGVSPISGRSYTYAPPDFNFFDVSSLRLGAYMGSYGGTLDKNNIGTIPTTVGYTAKGSIAAWMYGADVEKNPTEDPYVNDEIYGNYPGSGVLWLSPEMSNTKNPAESTFGNDTVHRFGAEVRRFILHQTDLAQPSVLWQGDTVANHATVYTGTPVNFSWKVNGSLVVDHTMIQYGNNPDPVNTYQYTTTDHDTYAGQYQGGTGWDNALNGQTTGVTYHESLIITTPGEYYFVAKAKVDQVYATVLRPDVYGPNSFLRLIKERTNASYYEVLQGTDGTEEIIGQTWWYSPVIHVSVIPENNAPFRPETPSGPTSGKPGSTYLYRTSAIDEDGDQLYYLWDWGDGTQSQWLGPYASGAIASAQHSWSEKGNYNVKVKTKDIFGAESDWSDPLPIKMPAGKNYQPFRLLHQLVDFIQQILHNLLN